MTFIIAIMAVPWLAATGIYKRTVMRHGHCIARPWPIIARFSVADHRQRDRITVRRQLSTPLSTSIDPMRHC